MKNGCLGRTRTSVNRVRAGCLGRWTTRQCGDHGRTRTDVSSVGGWRDNPLRYVIEYSGAICATSRSPRACLLHARDGGDDPSCTGIRWVQTNCPAVERRPHVEKDWLPYRISTSHRGARLTGDDTSQGMKSGAGPQNRTALAGFAIQCLANWLDLRDDVRVGVRQRLVRVRQCPGVLPLTL